MEIKQLTLRKQEIKNNNITSQKKFNKHLYLKKLYEKTI